MTNKDNDNNQLIIGVVANFILLAALLPFLLLSGLVSLAYRYKSSLK